MAPIDENTKRVKKVWSLVLENGDDTDDATRHRHSRHKAALIVE
jgi:hypothetical protein